MKPVLLIAAALVTCFSMSAQPVKVLLVTGGHSYDTLQFFQMFDSFEQVEYVHFNQPEANQAIVNGAAERFDVLVFYDMWRTITEPQKKAYLDMTRKGKSFLFLHHALVSYQNWSEFEKLLGGKYVENDNLPEKEQSTYKHDVWVDVEVVNDRHPVTLGMNGFRIFDEVYGNYKILPTVRPLLKTTHSESTPVIGWENRYNQSTVIYLQPGHDKNAYESPIYRKIVLQAINYLAGQKNR